MFYRKKHCHFYKDEGWFMLAPQKISFWVWLKELFTGRMGCCIDHHKNEELKEMMPKTPKPINPQLEWEELKGYPKESI